jgi:hypothetical protein
VYSFQISQVGGNPGDDIIIKDLRQYASVYFVAIQHRADDGLVPFICRKGCFFASMQNRNPEPIDAKIDLIYYVIEVS